MNVFALIFDVCPKDIEWETRGIYGNELIAGFQECVGWWMVDGKGLM